MTPDQIKALRTGSGQSQAAFARAYRVPLRTWQDYERGVRCPSGPALALLTAIAREPETMRRLLE